LFGVGVTVWGGGDIVVVVVLWFCFCLGHLPGGCLCHVVVVFGGLGWTGYVVQGVGSGGGTG